MDRVLDMATSGPRFVERDDIAGLVAKALEKGDHQFQRYHLHSFVIMPNHVRLLVTPRVAATRWLGPLKGFTAHRANQILRRHGAFWQDESYDHLVRSEAEFRRIRMYIENNPLKAGLVSEAERFRWSSAYTEPPEKAAAMIG
jgi:REP element-mobilizing transposase RayT